MDQVHIHLLITHLPIFGSILGGLVLAHGILSNSDQTKIAGYGVLITSSIGAVISYLTGEGAEEAVEDIQGVAKSMIEQHEDFALFALIGLITLGMVSLVALYLTKKNHPAAYQVSLITLLIAFVSFALVAWTGYLGGQIRHTEIGVTAPPNDNSEKDSD